MEVTTLDGHLLALFIDEPVASFRRIEETLVGDPRQGGLAIVPHPLSWLTRSVSAKRARPHRRDDERRRPLRRHRGVQPQPGRAASTSARARRAQPRAVPPRRCWAAATRTSCSRSAAPARRFAGTTAADLRTRDRSEDDARRARAARRGISELGYRNIALQQWRGMMATPRNMGWLPTIRSFIVSHAPPPAADRRRRRGDAR